jgi:hypothetical protein
MNKTKAGVYVLAILLAILSIEITLYYDGLDFGDCDLLSCDWMSILLMFFVKNVIIGVIFLIIFAIIKKNKGLLPGDGKALVLIPFIILLVLNVLLFAGHNQVTDARVALNQNWIAKATLHEDVSYCDEIQGHMLLPLPRSGNHYTNLWSLERECHTQVAEQTQDYNDCGGLVNCITNIAINSTDVNACYAIEEEYSQNECRRKVGDASLCKSTQYSCILGAAGKTRDISLCLTLPSEHPERDWQKDCITLVSQEFEDPKECFVIPDQIEKTRCIFGIASRLGDSSICEFITMEPTKEYCITSAIRNREEMAQS